MVFEIDNATLSYDKVNTVLQIPSFQIEKKGLYFFIGASGIGKSTFLETLGMMNNTIMENTECFRYWHANEEKTDLKALWTKTDQEISLFRKKAYSFIFQSTNLMPHFTAGENMTYTLLLEGESWENAKKKVLALMPSLGLDPSIFDKNIQYVSGGQRQRLAFLRAFVSSFEVLFGDEPTGNLDPVTAAGMMQTLSDFVRSENKTAIIVSHDIHLASSFADRIYYISKRTNLDKGSSFGYLDNLQYFEKKGSDWVHKGEKIKGSIIEVLKKYL